MGSRHLPFVLALALAAWACNLPDLTLLCDTESPEVEEVFLCRADVPPEHDCGVVEPTWGWEGSPESLWWEPPTPSIGPQPAVEHFAAFESWSFPLFFSEPDEGQLTVEVSASCTWRSGAYPLVSRVTLSATAPGDDDDSATDDDDSATDDDDSATDDDDSAGDDDDSATDDDDAVDPSPMGFFVTSEPFAGGGALGGLAGADAFCQQQVDAAPVDAAVKARDWRAYLGTTPIAQGDCEGLPQEDEASIDARDRIGEGPWHDFFGVEVAADVDELHKAGLAPARAVTELGSTLDADEPHVVTGADFDGLVSGEALQEALVYGFGAGNCCNWTSTSDFMFPEGGHWSAPAADWNHGWSAGCGGETFSDGARGFRLYCFAAD